REVVKALALSPAHPGATRTMVELLLAAPASVPAEVEAEAQNATMRHRLANLRATVLTFAIWIASSVVALLAGLRSPRAYGLSLGVMVAGLVYALWALHRRWAPPATTRWRPSRRPPWRPSGLGSGPSWPSPWRPPSWCSCSPRSRRPESAPCCSASGRSR